jgi:hypothetical protein
MNRILKVFGLSIAYITVKVLEKMIRQSFEKMATDKKQEQKQNGGTL